MADLREQELEALRIIHKGDLGCPNSGQEGGCLVCLLLDVIAKREAEREKWKRAYEEALALLDRRDGPPIYSVVLARSEQAEAALAKEKERGGEAWRSCGHVAWGTCSTCYVERGRELSAAQASLATERATSERLREAIQIFVASLQGGTVCLPGTVSCQLPGHEHRHWSQEEYAACCKLAALAAQPDAGVGAQNKEDQ